LRKAIEDRGLGHLIPEPDRVVANVAIELERGGKSTPATFDPLMNAHWAIAHNAMKVLENKPGSVQYLMMGDDQPEDPCELDGANGRTWSRCPLCYLGLAHELTCTGGKCKLPKVDGYAWMIDRAADDQLTTWNEMRTDT